MLDRVLRIIPCIVVLAAVSAGADASFAAVMKSRIPDAHYEANATARVDLNRAESRAQNKDVRDAVTAAEAATRADSLSGEAWQKLGLLRLSSGQDLAARTALERAALLSPDHPDIWTRLAHVSLFNLGFVAEGAAALDLALQADSTYGLAWYARGIFLWSRADLDGAQHALETARAFAASESQNSLWYSTLLGVYTSRGNYAQALVAIRNYRYEVEDDITALSHQAHAQRGVGDFRGALETLAILRASMPKLALWPIETGHAYRGLGLSDSARVWFTRAVVADSQSFDAGYNRALALAATRDTVRAWAELRRLRALDPQNWLVPLFASRLARAADDSARADLAFEEARRLNPALGLARAAAAGASVPAWSSPELESAEALIERGDFTLAIDRLYQAAQDSARLPAALYWLSHVTRVSAGKPGPSVIAAYYAAEASGGDPVVERLLAEAQISAADTARAVANLKAVRRAAPDDGMATALLAAILLHGGEAPTARTLFNEFAVEPTRSWRIESVRADVLAAVHDPGAAIAKTRAAAVDYLPQRGR